MKKYLQSYTPTQVCLLVAILLILAIGCENQGKTPVVLHPVDTVKVDTAAWVVDHSEIGKDGGR